MDFALFNHNFRLLPNPLGWVPTIWLDILHKTVKLKNLELGPHLLIWLIFLQQKLCNCKYLISCFQSTKTWSLEPCHNEITITLGGVSSRWYWWYDCNDIHIKMVTNVIQTPTLHREMGHQADLLCECHRSQSLYLYIECCCFLRPTPQQIGSLSYASQPCASGISPSWENNGIQRSIQNYSIY